MSELNKADEDRLRNVEGTLSTGKGAILAINIIFGFLFLIIIGVGGFFGVRVIDTPAEVGKLSERLSGVEKSQAKDVAHLSELTNKECANLKASTAANLVGVEKSIVDLRGQQRESNDRLEKKLDELSHRPVPVSFQLPPLKAFAQANLVAVVGKLATVTKDGVTVEVGAVKKAFSFTQATECFLGDRVIPDWRQLVGYAGQQTTLWLSGRNPAEIAVMEVEERRKPAPVKIRKGLGIEVFPKNP